MKFNFKKISAVVAGALMTGMAMGGAVSAASYPAPFVEDGQADAAVVYGSDALPSDESTASSLQADLDTYLEGTAPSTSSGLGDEYELIQGTGNDLTLWESLSDVESKLDDGDLPTVLAEGTIEDDSVDFGEEEEVDYDQEILLSTDQVKFDQLSDEEDYAVNTDAADDKLPVLYLDHSSDEAYELVVDFSSSINATAYDDSESFTVAGKELTFDPQMEAGDTELIMFEGTETVSLDYGQEKTVNGDTIELTGGSGDTANIKINGVTYSLDEGESKEGYYVKRVIPNEYGEEDTISVELFAGSNEWVIDGYNSPADIEVDGTTMEGVQANITSSTSDAESIDKISFIVTPSELEEDEKNYLEMGEEIEDPLFGSFKMLFDSVEPELKADSKGSISFSAADTLELSFTSRNGNEYSVAPLELDDSNNIVGGEDWYVNQTNTSEYVNLTKDDIFIASEGTGSAEETLIYQITKIDDGDSGEDDEEVTFEELSTGAKTVLSQGEELEDTGLYVPSNLANDIDSDGPINLTTDGSALATINTEIVTENGMSIEIPFLSDGKTTIINMTEDADDVFNMDSEGITPATLDVNLSVDTDDDALEVRTLPNANFSDVTVSDTDTEYGLSTFGTYYEADTDEYASLDVWTPSESYTTFNVYFSSTGETDSGDGSMIGDILVMDSEVDSVSDKNLIVVGGSCVNTAAASLLGVSEGTCGSDFTEATDIGSGQALIKGYSDSDLTSKHAVLVAGYGATDTSNAAKYLMNEKPDTSQAHKVTSATSATLISE